MKVNFFEKYSKYGTHTDLNIHDFIIFSEKTFCDTTHTNIQTYKHTNIQTRRNHKQQMCMHVKK